MSISEGIISATIRGQIPNHEALFMTAMDVYSCLSDYQPRPYPQAGKGLDDYVMARRMGATEYEQTWARRLGMFTYTIRELENKNFSDYDTLCWAAKLLWDHGEEDFAKTVALHAGKFKKFNRPFLTQCYEVQLLDAESRQRKSWN